MTHTRDQGRPPTDEGQDSKWPVNPGGFPGHLHTRHFASFQRQLRVPAGPVDMGHGGVLGLAEETCSRLGDLTAGVSLHPGGHTSQTGPCSSLALGQGPSATSSGRRPQAFLGRWPRHPDRCLLSLHFLSQGPQSVELGPPPLA